MHKNLFKMKVSKGGKYSFDNTYSYARSEFSGVMDLRKGDCRYNLGDILSMGFALFSLKSPIVLNFVEQTQTESANLKSVYQIDSFAKEIQWRCALDNVEEG